MRYIFIFGITLILALFIRFYNPYSDSLGIFDNDVCIEYNFDKEGYKWVYEADDNIIIDKKEDSKWIISSKKDGEYSINFYYIDGEDIDSYLYKIAYKFKFKKDKIIWTYGEGFGLIDFPDPY